MFKRFHPKYPFNFVDGRLVVTCEHGIDMLDDCLNIRRAILRHVFANRLKVLPEVIDAFDDS